MMCCQAHNDAYEVSFLSLLPPLTLVHRDNNLLYFFPVYPKFLSYSPSYWDCCNDASFSPSGSVYQEEEEVRSVTG